MGGAGRAFREGLLERAWLQCSNGMSLMNKSFLGMLQTMSRVNVYVNVSAYVSYECALYRGLCESVRIFICI